MTVIFIQVFILFTFVAVGYILAKTGMVNPENGGILSTLLVYVFLPCNVFLTFSRNFTVSYVTENREMVLLSVLLLAVVCILAHLFGKLLSSDSYESYLYEYSFIIPNYGYMGFSLAVALMGELGLMDLMTFSLPSCLYIYTIGFAKLTRRPLNFKKLFNPVIIATSLGIAAGLSGFTIPAFITDIMEKSTACLGPVSMLLTGIVVAELPIKRVVGNIRVYITIAVRMVIFPLILYVVLRPFCAENITQTVVLFYAMPCGLNTVVFPKLLNENCETGMGLALVSTVAACITLPVVLSVAGIM